MIGSILGGAFRLLRQRPGSVAAWSILYLVGIFVIGTARLMLMHVGARGGGGAAMLVPALATQLATLLLIAVLMTAVTRATLHPYKRGVFYLRFGGNELRVFALLAMLAVATGVVMFLLALFNGFLLSLLGWLVVDPGLRSVLATLLLLGELAALAFVHVRLSIALPLTYLYEAITVDEAWAQSRGHFWSIFGAFVAIGALVVAAWTVLIALFFGPILALLLQTGINPDALAQALIMMTIAARNLPVAAQLVLIAGTLALVAISFVLSAATLASAARVMLGLTEGQIPDLRRRG
ncbi:hypothetical protein ACX40Y_04890 [Sphingomonas sp. RS6]